MSALLWYVPRYLFDRRRMYVGPLLHARIQIPRSCLNLSMPPLTTVRNQRMFVVQSSMFNIYSGIVRNVFVE